MTQEPLKLVLKCIDYEEYGNLYALNQEIPEEEMEKVKPYFKKYAPTDFKDIMNIEGNPYGWMCQKENIPQIEEILNITETLEKQEQKREEQQKILNQQRKEKDKAMDKIEEIYTGAPRPSKFLKKLLKKADIVYDPGDSYYTDHEYGEGQLFIIDKNYIWYIINNGRSDDDYTLNNIKTEGPGAVGFRVAYNEELHELIKIVSNENQYKGK
ncbi:hypothetical protein [Methanosphaera sp.]